MGRGGDGRAWAMIRGRRRQVVAFGGRARSTGQSETLGRDRGLGGEVTDGEWTLFWTCCPRMWPLLGGCCTRPAPRGAGGWRKGWGGGKGFWGPEDETRWGRGLPKQPWDHTSINLWAGKWECGGRSRSIFFAGETPEGASNVRSRQTPRVMAGTGRSHPRRGKSSLGLRGGAAVTGQRQGCIGRGGEVPPSPSRAPAYAELLSLTTSASPNGVRNRQ